MNACLNTAGLGASLVGVILLFRYGMPYHIDTGGGHMIVTESTPEILKAAALYRKIGFVGLGLIIAGTLLQIVANYIPSN
jgi:hypothetical protein